MCDPFTIAAVAVSAAANAYGVYQQKQNAEATEEYQKEIHKANSEIATQNALNQYVATQRRQTQEREAAAVEIQKVAQTSARAQGTARAAAAARGTAGLSVDALLGDFERQELEFQTQAIRTEQFRSEQFERERQSIRSGLQGQVLSTLPQPVQQPDFVGAALRVASAGISARASQSSSES